MPEYLLSDQSFRAMHYAIALCDARRPSVIEVIDWLGGLYVSSFDRLSRYWEDPEGLRRLVEGQPGIANLITGLKAHGLGPAFAGREGIFKPLSSTLKSVWARAEALATPKVLGQAEPSTIKLLPEHFLLAMAEAGDPEIGRELLVSGLRVNSLREDVQSGTLE